MKRLPTALLLIVAAIPASANDGNIDLGYGLEQGVSASFTTPEAFVQQTPAMAVTASGRTWLIQSPDFSSNLVIARFITSTGLPDLGFGPNADGRHVITLPAGLAYSNVASVVAQNDNRIIVAGYGNDASAPDATVALICRLTVSGSLDASFDTDGCRSLRSFETADEFCSPLSTVIDASDRIVTAGFCDTGVNHSFVARLTSSGALDVDFAAGAGFKLLEMPAAAITSHNIGDIVMDGNGRMVASVGLSYNNNPQGDAGVIRLDDGGSFDLSFGTNGLTNTSTGLASTDHEYPGAIALRPDGRIVVTVVHSPSVVIDQMLIAQLTSDGLMDPTIGGGSGRVITPATPMAPLLHYSRMHMTLDEQERVIVATDLVDGNWKLAIERFLANGHPDPTFGVAGRALHDLTLAIGEAAPVSNQMGGVAALGGQLLLGGSIDTTDHRSAFTLFRTENGSVFKDSFE